ncbi:MULTISPECIES: GTP pyrophosphokinase family protein [unclassified Pedobacter]|uniref:GTP pyrophosphokinase n=1 Tax=unclassified Pedobacter TaxID=2628915 RepID=UPI00142387FD|nr:MULTISPECIES: RelA/SpoT domain-containing protein [unclassified Pedobacter]NII83489.1 ppGpp synthetase/RelA/SpoT-type nucleotidyltransferase [Pedobacter sp. SG908]NMN37353.1 ppGpp synthetase/RelA/SpoT-type nucleotidyltransferase [Pedobacter sp. SG918]
MNVIEEFIKQYNKEYDYYHKLSQIVSGKIEDQLFKRGIKAIVTFRAKKPDRLLEKLTKRNQDKNYQSVKDIYNDIVDLAGIRVSLYFPSERDILDEIISELFVIDNKKKFPEQAHKPLHKKRFSGYWANHYRVQLKDDGLIKRYSDTTAEIQVASVLMHAWSEVEHDLVYKPFSGNLSASELAILDEINGLVLTGEIALERLQAAMAERTRSTKDIKDKYELTNFLLNNLAEDYHDKIKLGDTFLLNNFLKINKSLSTSIFTKFINKINTDLDETVTDQLLNMLFVEFNNKTNLVDFKQYFKNLQIPEKKASIFELFVKYWVILEKATREFLTDDEKKSRKYMIPNFSVLTDKNVLNANEAGVLNDLRKLRNYLLHGIDTPTDSHLKKSVEILKTITLKVISQIENVEHRDRLLVEMDKLN